ncbi:hypothetical protein [Rhodoferax sp.]|uniref:hypothetical protein n=1 Tax=Rhodoferax sp. TaxID=50421 RepID=UPI0027326FB2|nr:hypothetical protein [Rhodoferax sp.]MDP3191042.1 hypothetical protein [Rhodoferax sp.]MDP3864370.1 hypothetical protein [Rhodoferax sp.]
MKKFSTIFLISLFFITGCSVLSPGTKINDGGRYLQVYANNWIFAELQYEDDKACTDAIDNISIFNISSNHIVKCSKDSNSIDLKVSGILKYKVTGVEVPTKYRTVDGCNAHKSGIERDSNLATVICIE